MAKVAKIPALDPTLPDVKLTLGDTTYNLCFTFAALRLAEVELKKMGEPVNIFHAFDFDNMDAGKMVSLLYAAVVTDKPEIQLESIPKLITLRDVAKIKQALFDAFTLSIVEPDKDAPAVPLDKR